MILVPCTVCSAMFIVFAFKNSLLERFFTRIPCFYFDGVSQNRMNYCEQDSDRNEMQRVKTVQTIKGSVSLRCQPYPDKPDNFISHIF